MLARRGPGDDRECPAIRGALRPTSSRSFSGSFCWRRSRCAGSWPGATCASARASLALIGTAYGFLAGTTIGGGILVIPALLGAGLAGIALLATDAVIGLSVLTIKTVVFGGFDVLTPRCP